jgi:hypothetical protein
MQTKSFLRIIPILTLAAALGLVGSAAWGQATRTWVSGVGDDANPCSRTAPCKTFAGAISKTAAAGEINVLDPGGFGAVTITKSITIDGSPFLSGVVVSGTNGIVINAGINDVVTLRNLDINGLNTGLSGIKFLAGKALYVEGCRIYGFNGNPGRGIDFAPTSAGGNVAQLFVQNSDIRENLTLTTGGGIVLTPGASISAKAVLDNVRVERNNTGVLANANASVVARHTTSVANRLDGFSATGAGATLFLDNCTSAVNGGAGVVATAGGVARITECSITANTTGISGVQTFLQTNSNSGNTSDGTPIGTINRQ